MNKQLESLVDALKTFDIPVLADEIAEDEEEQFKKDGYHLFVYETSDVTPGNDNKSLVQEVVVYYYSENRDDLDEQMLDIIEKLSVVRQLDLTRIFKQRFKRKDTDNYLDRLAFAYNRVIPIGCQL